MNAAQLGIDMAGGKEPQSNEINGDEIGATQANKATLDLRRSLNGLKVGISLLTSCVWKGDDAETTLKELIDLTQNLSKELLPEIHDTEEEKRQAVIIRTAILRCVEEVAKQDKIETLSSSQLIRLFEIASELGSYETLPSKKGNQSFDLSFLVAIGFNTSSLTEDSTSISEHLSEIKFGLNETFAIFEAFNISTSALSHIKVIVLDEIIELHRQLVMEEKERRRLCKLAKIDGEEDLKIVEMKFKALLKSIIEATIANTKVSP